MTKSKIKSVSWKINNILEKKIFYKHYNEVVLLTSLRIEPSFVNQVENNLYEKI